MAKFLITGLTGFTGRYLAQTLLTQGHQIFGISSHSHNPAQGIYQANLNDIVGLVNVLNSVQPTYIVHLAAIAFVAHGDSDAIYHTNLLGTQHLLQAIYASGIAIEHILLASSANVYGNSKDESITEQTTPAPANDYAVSKLAMEYMAKTWGDKLPITIARPFNYTGIGQDSKFLIPKIVKHFKEKSPTIELGNLDVVRDFSDVRDVVTAYSKLIMLPAQTETYNVCSGIGTSLSSVIEMMESISHHHIEVFVNPTFVRVDEVKCLIGNDRKIIERIHTKARYSLLDTLTWMYARACP